MENNSDIILNVQGLKTHFHVLQGILKAVDGVSFSVKRGKMLALVGESGCGKSVTAYSILRLIQPPGRIVSGKITLHPRNEEAIDITALHPKAEQLYHVRGGLIGMIFQEPISALSPVHTIGNQICEAILLHRPTTKAQARDRAAAMLNEVGITNPQMRLNQYPHEMSGGLRQRVGIAMALVCNPQLLIADEPTTALDVTIQAQILALLKNMSQRLDLSTILITHDLAVVSQTADEVAVMYLGRIVERAPVRALLKSPQHPYTRALLKSIPSLGKRRERLKTIEGSVPALYEIPTGCPFHPRCKYAQPGRCDVGDPPQLTEILPGRDVACIRAEEIE